MNHGLQKPEKSEIAAAAALTFFCCHLQSRAVVGVCDVDVNQLALGTAWGHVGVGLAAEVQQEGCDLCMAHLGCDVEHAFSRRAVTFSNVTTMLSE